MHLKSWLYRLDRRPLRNNCATVLRWEQIEVVVVSLFNIGILVETNQSIDTEVAPLTVAKALQQVAIQVIF